MNEKRLEKRRKEIWGEFTEIGMEANPRIGESFYSCAHAHKKDNTDQHYIFTYLGTDRKTVKIKVKSTFYKNGKTESKYADILELPLENNQALFEPRYVFDLRKDFLITLIDELGHIEIKAKDRK